MSLEAGFLCYFLSPPPKESSGWKNPPDVQKWVRSPVTSVNRLCNLSKQIPSYLAMSFTLTSKVFLLNVFRQKRKLQRSVPPSYMMSSLFADVLFRARFIRSPLPISVNRLLPVKAAKRQPPNCIKIVCAIITYTSDCS